MRKLAAFFTRPNGSALAFMIAGAIWFVFGTSFGLISAIDLVAPDTFQNFAPATFGRIRPGHVNTVIYGFGFMTLTGCGLYYVPATLRTRLWSEPLGWISFVLLTGVVAAGPVCFASGVSQGREYTEYPWVLDIILLAAVFITIVNLVMTILKRCEKELFVSVWYFTGAFMWFFFLYAIGNVIWSPPAGALPGIVDSPILWYYGHNLVGLLLTPLAVGAAYFVIPRVVNAPIYSYALSIVGFWTLVILYTHIGGHHILQAPIPNWLKTISMIHSVGMTLPVFAVLVNVWMTARGRIGRLVADPAGRLVFAGTVWYLITCVQGPLQSLPVIQRVTHFNNWTIGHSHIAVLGFAGFIALGTLWHVLPLACGRRLWSGKLVNVQFALVLFGLTGFFVVLTIAGLIQGESWNNGFTIYRIIPEIIPYMVIRLASGLFIYAGAWLGLYILFRTLFNGEPLGASPEALVMASGATLAGPDGAGGGGERRSDP